MILIEKEATLTVGDSFGLLPDEFWFRIEETNENGELDLSLLPNIKQEKSDEGEPSDSNKCTKRQLESTECPNSKKPKNEEEGEASVSSAAESNVPNVVIKKEKEEEQEEAKVKTEPPDNPPNDDEPGCSNNNGNSSDNSNDNSKNNAPNPQRDCCKFSIKCYRLVKIINSYEKKTINLLSIKTRRNHVEHNAELAHPGDADYRLPDYARYLPNMPNCPYRHRCYRRNPMHFDQFSHPPASK